MMRIFSFEVVIYSVFQKFILLMNNLCFLYYFNLLK